MHYVVYIYVRLCSVPHRPGFRFQHSVAQNNQIYTSQRTVCSMLKGAQTLILGLSLTSPSLSPHYCLLLLPLLLHCSGPAFSADTISPGSVLYLISDLGVLAERVEPCSDLAFLCVYHCTPT